MSIGEPEIPRFQTGIDGLDLILHGGLLVAGVYIIQGVPGAGKTILANEICFRHVAQGGHAAYVTLLAESHTRMLQHLRPMAFFDESRVPDDVYYMSAFATLEEEGLKGLLVLLRREMRNRKASLLVLDGLMAAEEFSTTAREFKKFIHELQSHAAANGCTVLMLTSGAASPFSAEHTMVDGLIELGDEQHTVRNMRMLQVRKLRGSGALRGKHAYRISPQGIRIFPRIEAWLDTPTAPDPGFGRRLMTGSVTLDRILKGGVCLSSVTAIVGPTGAGKTLLSLQFLAQSSRQEPGLMFTTYETRARLVEKAQAVGQDVSGLLENGALDILWHSQGENLIDELAHELLQAVKARNVKRLVIDGLGGLLEATPHTGRMSRFMSCLMNELRAQGVATLITMETTEVVGSSVQLPITGMSAIVDNLLFLRFVERNARLSRLVSIIKMRNSDYDPFVREMTITDQGLVVGEPLFGFDATTTGVARTVPSADVDRSSPGKGT